MSLYSPPWWKVSEGRSSLHTPACSQLVSDILRTKKTFGIRWESLAKVKCRAGGALTLVKDPSPQKWDYWPEGHWLILVASMKVCVSGTCVFMFVRVYIYIMRVYACAGQSHSSLLVITRMCSPAPCLLHPLTNLALPSLFMADAPYRTPIEGKKKKKKPTERNLGKEISNWGVTERSFP